MAWSPSVPADDVLREQNGRLVQENQRLQAECHKLQGMLDDADRKVPQYETALDKLQRKYTETLAQLDQEREKSYSGKALMNSREARYTRQQQLVEELQAELRKLKSSETVTSARLTEERREAARVKAQLSEALRTANDTRGDAKRLHRDLVTLQRELKVERDTTDSLQAQLAEAREHVHRVGLRDADWEDRFRRQAAELAEAKRARDTDVWQARHEERRVVGRELDLAHAEVSRLRDQLFRAGTAPYGTMYGATMPAPMPPPPPPPPPAAAYAAAAPARAASPTHPAEAYRAGFDDGVQLRRDAALTSSAAIVDKDAPSARRLRRGRGALPVDRSQEGDLIATCRRRHCLKRFNVNDNCSPQCGYHPVPPTTSFDGDFFPCCGVLVRPGSPNVFCQFRPHLA